MRKLIEAQSRRRAAATGGESRIPLDDETERCVAEAGFALDDVPPAGRELRVRKTANLHTGGTIHDVTDETHPDAGRRRRRSGARHRDPGDRHRPDGARARTQPDYVFIEANERPGLANHEPQPTAERFVDLLFPHSIPSAARTVRQGVAR